MIYSARKAVHRLNRVAPQIMTEMILGAGHDPTFSQSEMVNATILRFLTRNGNLPKAPGASAG